MQSWMPRYRFVVATEMVLTVLAYRYALFLYFVSGAAVKELAIFFGRYWIKDILKKFYVHATIFAYKKKI